MKSAIFDSEPRRKPLMRSTASPWRNNRRAHSSSPLVGSITKKEMPTPGWNLQDMLASYHDHGILPPILSPTIPQKEDQNEDIPLSMISPTLPSQFTLEHPAPRRPKILAPSQPAEKVRVRWINKLDQPRPRFVLRLKFEPEMYQRAFKVTGLGITADGKAVENAASVSTLVARLHRLLKESKKECERSSGDRLVAAAADYLLLQILLSTQEKSIESWNRAGELATKLSNTLSAQVKGATALKGVVYIVHAVILRQEVSTLRALLTGDMSPQKTIDLQKRVIKRFGDIEQYMKRASQHIGLLQLELPVSFSRLKSVPPAVHRVIEPSNEPYMLPLAPYSGIGEACGLLYQAVSETRSYKWRVDGVKVEV